MSRAKVMIMAGGTGGHVIPGLTIAKALEDSGCTVVWLGVRGGIEEKLVPKANIKIEYITVAGLRGKNLKNIITSLKKLFKALFQCFSILKEQRPDVILGMGGYVSGPGGIAGFLMRYPLIIHEQNSIPGTTNKLLSKIASSVLEAFPNSFEKKVNAKTVGNPIRNEIISIEQPKERLDGRDFPIRILILGGSQGSLVLNKSVPNSIKEIASIAKLEVLHQAGSKTIKEAQKSYENVPVGLYLVEFIDEIADAYQWADIVICRAGAMTVSELLAAGLPAIFIPFSLATDDHQTENAKFMKEIGAAEIVSENEIEKGALSLILRDWIQDRAILKRRSCLARSSSKSGATNAVVETCLNYVDQNE